MSGVSCPPSTTQTRRTRPCGRVLCVWGVPSPSYYPDMKNATVWSRSLCLGCPLPLLPPRHEERDHRVAFFMSGFPSPSYHPDTKNATVWSRSLCLGCPLPLLPPRHEERDPVVAFFMSGFPSALPTTSHHPSLPLILNTRTSPCGLVLVLGHVLSTLLCLEHHNVPVWACSGAQAHLSLTSLPVFTLVLNISSSHHVWYLPF